MNTSSAPEGMVFSLSRQNGKIQDSQNSVFSSRCVIDESPHITQTGSRLALWPGASKISKLAAIRVKDTTKAQ